MINQEIIQEAITTILEEGLNQDIQENPHLTNTPKRVANAFTEVFEGYVKDPLQYNTTFPNTKGSTEIILLGPIQTYSVCSHHILPFKVDIYIAYIPDKEIIGISKLERIAKNICHKLQVQENIGQEIIEVLNEILNPKGVLVYINNSEHLCMSMRGVKTRNAGLTTIVTDGLFKEEEYQTKFFKMIKQ